MAGERVAGAPDPTGMAQAQNADRQGTALARRQAAVPARSSFWEHVPFTTARARAKEREAEIGRIEAQAMRDAAGFSQRSAEANVDEEAIVGEHLTRFNNAFLSAIRTGYSRTEEATSADSIIREVVTQDAFIHAIRSGTVRTPLEQMDTVRQTEYAERRARLADTLTTARNQREYMIGTLTANEVDILYATFIGTQEDSIPGAVSTWERERNWPADIPKPHQAFFIFLEGAAIREAGGSKGEFIGNVLKGLTIKRTFLDTQESTLRMLADSAYINEYLYSTSSFPIDRAVESFHSAVVGLLSTPTGQKDAVLGMPGLGYRDAFPAIRAEKEAWVDEARHALAQDDAVIAQAKTAVESAQAGLEQAQQRLNNALAIIKTAEKQGSVRLAGDVVVSKGDPRLKAGLEKHKREVQAAKDELGSSIEYQQKALLAKAKHEKDLLWREREFSRFLSTETPEAVAKELSRHFRDLLEAYKGMGGRLDASGKPLSCFDDVATRMAERLPNPAITVLLDKAMGLMEDMMSVKAQFDPSRIQERLLVQSLDDGRREQLALLAKDGNSEAAAILLKEIKGKVNEERDDTETFEFKKRAYDQKIAELGAAIEDTELPEEVKERLRAMHTCMSSLRYEPGDIADQADRIRRAFALPLGKAALHSVRKLEEQSFRNLIGISDAEKIIARMTFESRSGNLPAAPGKGESGWKRFYQKVRYHLFTTESWISRDKNRPGKLVWLYRKTIAEDLSDLRPKNWFQRRPGRRPDGTPYRRITPRVLDGLFGLTVKGYIVGGALFGYLTTTQDWHWYWPPSWVARPTTMLAESINGGRIYAQDPAWYKTWTWFMPSEAEREVRAVINDSYEIPERLASRGDDYYRDFYGVGTRRLASETDDSGKGARLEWLKTHPEVLRYLQERVSLRKVVSWRESADRVNSCSTSQKMVPETCEGLGLKTLEAIEAYRPISYEGRYKRGQKVCCFIELETSAITDGLKLNPLTADAFVDELMALERGGGKADYAYLANPANRARWVNQWYLITPTESDIIRNFKINMPDNVRFVRMQAAGSTLLLPRCAEEALAPEFLRVEKRDDFVGAWREELVRAAAEQVPPVELDPITQPAPAELLRQSFESVQAAHLDWFADRTTEFNRREVAQKLADLRIETETALDVLVAQPALVDVLKQFNSRATYSVTEGRADEFVQILDQHVRLGGSLDDFSPSSVPNGGGTKLPWAQNMGIVRANEVFEGEGAQDRGQDDSAAPAQPGAAARPAPGAQQQIADLSAAATKAYANPANEGFRTAVEGSIRAMFTEQGKQQLSERVLASRFGGDRARMERAIKEDVFRYMESGLPGDRRTRQGLTVEGSGENMTVSLGNIGRVRDTLSNRIWRYLNSLARQ